VNRVWVLHDSRITDFPGTFAEWEIASEEREHAAQVSAAEEESLRRVHEKQKTKRREEGKGKQRDISREARRKAEAAEQLVSDLEGRIVKLTNELADPVLYTTDAGKRRAVEAGTELDAVKKRLDQAIEAWTAATEAAEEAGARA